jgi:hypothetical protein
VGGVGGVGGVGDVVPESAADETDSRQIELWPLAPAPDARTSPYDEADISKNKKLLH